MLGYHVAPVRRLGKSLVDRVALHVRSRGLCAAACFAVAVAVAGCGSAVASAGKGQIVAVGAENEYANVISQIAGPYVVVSAIESNPNTDPHSFEASPSVARTVAAARLVVQNGVGYDTFMNRIESASPSSSRKVIDVQTLLGLPDSTPNPHLWYAPRTMPAVAAALVKALSAIEPSHAAYFAANAKRFDASLDPWYPGAQAVRRPLSAYARRDHRAGRGLHAPSGGTVNMTPFQFQSDVMNGVDPAPQAVTLQDGLFSRHRVKVFLYNQQVTDSLTESFLAKAKQNGIPVVGVYETMPTPGYDYQSWMLAEVNALQRAVADHTSTERLQ